MSASKRYQNISTMTTSVVKKSANGEFKSATMKPGQIIHVDEQDIEMTKDSYNPRENNPFDRGFVALIPEGKTTHPKAPKLNRNPSPKQAQEAVKAGVDEAKAVISKIQDYRGLTIMRRALDAERKALSDSQFSEINRLIDRQVDKVERVQKENSERLNTVV
jgi:hypothetical protein